MLQNFKQQQGANQNLFHTASAAEFTEQKNYGLHIMSELVGSVDIMSECWAARGSIWIRTTLKMK